MKLIKTPDNLKEYFTDEQWARMKQELDEIDEKIKNGEKLYTWEEIIEELDNQTEEEVQDIKREIEEDYEKIYGEKFNWNDMDELVKELESYTK